MTLTKDMEEDFKFMARYSYTDKNQQKGPYTNRIFWHKKILFATCGAAFIWTETEENPEGFSVWEVRGNKFVKREEGVKDLWALNMDNIIFRRYDAYSFDFTFCWDKDIPFPTKLCSTKDERFRDRSYFDFVNNDFIVKFSENDYFLNVTATYGDFFSDMSGDIPEGLGLPFWEILSLVKHTKDSVKIKVGSIKSEVLRFSQFCKMSSGKWNIIATSLI